MSATVVCFVCKSRKGKRSCPSEASTDRPGDPPVNQEHSTPIPLFANSTEAFICPHCCARGREETIDCPFNCEYLVESREHQKPQPLDEFLHADLFPGEEFVANNRQLFNLLCVALFTAALEVEGPSPDPASTPCIDRDLHDCLEGAIGRLRAKAAGLESTGRPTNPIAAKMLDAFLARIEGLQQHSVSESRGPIPYAGILKMTVFLRVFGQAQDNQRRKSRAFLHLIAGLSFQFAPQPGKVLAVEPKSSLIL